MPETQDLRELLRVFSPGRMQPYVAASGGDLRVAFRLYAWNVAVSAAFSGPLHCLEVVLRNAMHVELAARLGREDWWSHPSIRLHTVAKDSIADARAKIRRRNKEVTADRIVAELNLGFWTALLGKGINYETQLWPALRRRFRTTTDHGRACMRRWRPCGCCVTGSPTWSPFIVGTTWPTIKRCCA